ncbi:hypothetical protein Pan181_23640 [Aeoliella mucimassa]|uniref:Uncharacterized protein n=1 Tax=Aeoliella mucimassa TaxID=2527972 RepID=A0A518AN69_9BACT|nr:hypothetical protein Pan181_23640 [Aeoliella mucimassa]
MNINYQSVDVPKEPRLLSLGRCCRLLDLDTDGFRILAHLAAVEPALELDEVRYFTPSDLAVLEALRASQDGTGAPGG